MGCTVAVYDCVIREKADGGGEISCARRGTKRRGKRKGRRNARKCRRLVTADPDFCSQPSLQSVVSTTGERKFSLSAKRRSYLLSRRDAYSRRLLGTLVRLGKRLTARNPHTGQFTYPRAHKLGVSVKRRLVDFRSRTTGDSYEFSRIAVNTLIQVSSLGWESLPSLSTDTVREALEESGIEYDSHSDLAARSVDALGFKPEVFAERGKDVSRGRGARASRPSNRACRHCGYFGPEVHTIDPVSGLPACRLVARVGKGNNWDAVAKARRRRPPASRS
jgi:hypothetical protein